MSKKPVAYKEPSGGKFQVTNEAPAARCEICHQSDAFEPNTEFCARCNNTALQPTEYNKSAYVDSADLEILEARLKSSEEYWDLFTEYAEELLGIDEDRLESFTVEGIIRAGIRITEIGTSRIENSQKQISSYPATPSTQTKSARRIKLPDPDDMYMWTMILMIGLWIIHETYNITLPLGLLYVAAGIPVIWFILMLWENLLSHGLDNDSNSQTEIEGIDDAEDFNKFVELHQIVVQLHQVKPLSARDLRNL